MNPKLILAFWRERWGKPDISLLQVPYIDGRICQWGIRIAQQMRWSSSGVVLFLIFMIALFYAVLLPISFSLTSQVVFSVLLLICALILRPHAGVLPTLILIGLSFITSARYLYWRMTSTLAHDTDTIFVLSLVLLLAELYYSIQVVLHFIEVRWPIKRDQSDLRNDSNLWPKVDVFIASAGKSLSEIHSMLTLALELEWPKHMLKIFLLDEPVSEEVNSLADSMGVKYIKNNINTDGKPNVINLALMESKGDFILILDSDDIKNKKFLQNTLGWFLRDAKLGMLLSPQHFLAPLPLRITRNLFDDCDLNASFAILRCSMLLKFGEEEKQFLPSPEFINEEMKAYGYERSYVGIPRLALEDLDVHAVDIVRPELSTIHYFRVNQPVLNSRLLKWRLKLASLQIALNFYEPVVRLAFMLAPLSYLFYGVKLVQANIALFAAYVLPHLFHWYIAKARLENKTRLTLWTDFKDSVLALYISIKTTISLYETVFNQARKNYINGSVGRRQKIDFSITIPIGCVIFLNLLGLMIGIVNFPVGSHLEWSTAFFYLSWAFFNLLYLSGFKAVANEVRQVEDYKREQVKRPVMLGLSLGRTLSSVTENFPEDPIRIRLPSSTNLTSGSPIYLTFFKSNREYSFLAEVNSINDKSLTLLIKEESKDAYIDFKEAVYSRGNNWPMWLPDRNSDNLLPRWLYKTFHGFLAILLSLRKNYNNNARLNLKNLTSLWKKLK